MNRFSTLVCTCWFRPRLHIAHVGCSSDYTRSPPFVYLVALCGIHAAFLPLTLACNPQVFGRFAPHTLFDVLCGQPQCQPCRCNGTLAWPRGPWLRSSWALRVGPSGLAAVVVAKAVATGANGWPLSLVCVRASSSCRPFLFIYDVNGG